MTHSLLQFCPAAELASEIMKHHLAQQLPRVSVMASGLLLALWLQGWLLRAEQLESYHTYRSRPQLQRILPRNRLLCADLLCVQTMQPVPCSLVKSQKVLLHRPTTYSCRVSAASRRVIVPAAQQQQQHAVQQHAVQHAVQHSQDYMTQRHETVLEYFPTALGEPQLQSFSQTQHVMRSERLVH